MSTISGAAEPWSDSSAAAWTAPAPAAAPLPVASGLRDAAASSGNCRAQVFAISTPCSSPQKNQAADDDELGSALVLEDADAVGITASPSMLMAAAPADESRMEVSMLATAVVECSRQGDEGAPSLIEVPERAAHVDSTMEDKDHGGDQAPHKEAEEAVAPVTEAELEGESEDASNATVTTPCARACTTSTLE